jgi:putative aldouronate transport system permease protein
VVSNKIKRSTGERAFDAFNVTFLILICFAMIAPIMHVVAGSFSSKNALIHSRVTLWPVEFTIESYKLVIRNAAFWRAFSVSATLVLIGTSINMVMTMLTAYPLSKSDLKGRKAIMFFIVFTMIFSAPIIPQYLVVKHLGLMDTIWALIIPGAMSSFNMILCMTYFRGLPEELFDAARIDGLSEFGILIRIALPLSLPIIVTLLLFYSVGHWNSYYGAALYITNARLRPLQMYLYNVIAQSTVYELGFGSAEDMMEIDPESVKMATIVTSALPVVMIYPFIQRHFIKGALLGSVKE